MSNFLGFDPNDPYTSTFYGKRHDDMDAVRDDSLPPITGLMSEHFGTIARHTTLGNELPAMPELMQEFYEMTGRPDLAGTIGEKQQGHTKKINRP